jgi:hypothetical protein
VALLVAAGQGSAATLSQYHEVANAARNQRIKGEVDRILRQQAKWHDASSYLRELDSNHDLRDIFRELDQAERSHLWEYKRHSKPVWLGSRWGLPMTSNGLKVKVERWITMRGRRVISLPTSWRPAHLESTSRRQPFTESLTLKRWGDALDAQDMRRFMDQWLKGARYELQWLLR